MPGRPEFSQAGTNGGGQTVAVSNRPELSTIQRSQSNTVTSGGLDTVEIFAPEGSVYTIVAMRLSVPSIDSATSGDHRIFVRPVDHVRAYEGKASFDGGIFFTDNHWKYAGLEMSPSNDAAAVANIRSLKATENSPLVIKYQNNTDTAHSQEREIRFVVEEESY